MRRLPLYVLASALTFLSGVTITTIYVIRHYRLTDSISAEEASRDTGLPKTIGCLPVIPPLAHQVEAAINKDGESAWRSSETVLTGKEDLQVIKFVNAKEGWVGGSKASLYKTADAGNTWSKIPLDLPPDTYIISISFASPATGWIVAAVDSDQYISDKSWVLNTTDGGRTWKTQYYDKSLRIRQVRSVGAREVWAVGDRVSIHDFDKGFIIRSVDGGEHWTDLSSKADNKEGGNLGSILNVFAQSPSKAIILKFSRQFFSTEDGGASWRPVAGLPEEPPQAILDRFDVIGDNRMWAVGGADSIEGMWGTLARMNSNCSWEKYSIGGVYFADASFASENEVFVCGHIPSPGNERPRQKRDGLVMNSIDGGINWTVVYRNPETLLGSMTRADSKNFWAAGANGYIVHLQPK